MSDEQEQQEVEQEQPTTEPVVEGAAPAVSEEVDDRGVPIKNVIAELNRKLAAATEKIQELESKVVPQPYAAPITPEPAPQPVVRKSREEVLAEINADPEAWIEKKFREKEQVQQEAQRKARLAEADKMLYEKDPKNYKDNVQKVLTIIQRYGISTADPVRGVNAALDILDKETKLSLSAREQVEAQKKVVDQVRTEQIKKTSTPSVSKPKTKVTDDKDELLSRVRQTGDQKDAQAFFRNAWFNDDRK